MKKLFFTIVTLFFVDYTYAQFPMKENALEYYFKENIQSLQPFEGLYSAEYTTTIFSFSGVSKYNHKKAIVFSNGSYKMGQYDKNKKMYLFNDEYIYNEATRSFIRKSDGRTFQNINNPNYFVLNTDYGDGGYDRGVFTKYYPTTEMYNEVSNIESKISHACDLIENKFFSSALAILDDVLKTREGPREYYYRASAYYGLKNFYAAIQDCNFALSYNNSEQNNYMIYYLRGLCRFLTDDKESGIADMEKAGEDGAKFLEEEGYTKTSARSQNVSKSNSKVPTAKRNNTPILKKTK